MRGSEQGAVVTRPPSGNSTVHANSLSRERRRNCMWELVSINRDLRLCNFPIQNTSQRKQGTRSARRTTRCAITDAFAVLAEVRRSQRNMFHHWGSHDVTCLLGLPWWTQIVLCASIPS